MSAKQFAATALRTIHKGLTAVAIFQLTVGNAFAAAAANPPSRDNETASPIKHVIVIVGENRSFDHVFATYVPKQGESVWNLLSEGIVQADGTPGPNFDKAEQKQAVDIGTGDAYLLSPQKTKYKGGVMPIPLAGGQQTQTITALATAQSAENGLAPEYYQSLTKGATGLKSGTPDTRIKYAENLPAGPFQLTGEKLQYTDYAASPVHRFYQMWQQLDCDSAKSTAKNPSGCDARLFPWVETTIGAGSNGTAQAANFSTNWVSGAKTTGEGSTAMAFYNVQQGDAPYFKQLADTYSMSDNFHQSVDGGTGANHIMLGHGDMIYFSDGKGHAAVPPHNVASGSANLDEVENPNPASGTNNWYTEDGYGAGNLAAPQGGGSYSDCSDKSQPGVEPIVSYLKSLTPAIAPNCQKNHYYLLNNYNPGYFGDGSNAFTDKSSNNTIFTIPPSSVRSIGDEMLDKDISWKYYGDQWNNYLADKYQLKSSPSNGAATDAYCTICNPFQYDTSIMANKTIREAHIQDTANLYSDIQNDTLPAVSIVKPSGLVDGHPASSKLDLFEGFSKKIVDAVKANPKLWKDTAIFITFDEGGGYYDSGYVQPLDFFGDGTRIPLIAVSKFSKGGHITHEYSDHVSILKFIEHNWGLETVTKRSRDTFPNPIATKKNPYAPINSPAISDLFELFDFNN